MLQLCPISLMQLPALPRHMAPSILFSNRSSCTTWFACSLFHSQRPLRSTTAFALSQRAQLLALPLMCGLWIPGSAAWHTPGCTLGPTQAEKIPYVWLVCWAVGQGQPHKELLCNHTTLLLRANKTMGFHILSGVPAHSFPLMHAANTRGKQNESWVLQKLCPSNAPSSELDKEGRREAFSGKSLCRGEMPTVTRKSGNCCRNTSLEDPQTAPRSCPTTASHSGLDRGAQDCRLCL